MLKVLIKILVIGGVFSNLAPAQSLRNTDTFEADLTDDEHRILEVYKGLSFKKAGLIYATLN